MMVRWREVSPFSFAIMVGDFIYQPDSPADYRRKFEEPYGPRIRPGADRARRA